MKVTQVLWPKNATHIFILQVNCMHSSQGVTKLSCCIFILLPDRPGTKENGCRWCIPLPMTTTLTHLCIRTPASPIGGLSAGAVA